MGLLLCFLLFSLIVGTLIVIGNCRDRDAFIYGVVGFGISSLVFGAFSVFILGVSYGSYVDIRTKYDATLEQYRDAVTMYADHAAIDIKKVAFTDFKYKGYQENVADFIKSLRGQIVDYNETLISKRVMDKTFMFNWLIVAPDDDMKPISMLEGTNAANR